MNPLISVIIPVYNTECYLRRCMESVMGQTYRNLEIICIDDGSTDGSGAMLDAYVAEDSRIKVVHQKNRGQTAARKLAVSMAEGEYVSYVDSDDEIALTRYEELLDRGIKQKADIIFADLTQVYGDGSQLKIKNYFAEGFYSRQRIEDEILTKLCDSENFYVYILRTYGPCVLYSKPLISLSQSCVSDEIIYGEDVATLLLCLVNAKSVYMAHAGMYYYYKNPGSTCHPRKETPEQFERMRKSDRAFYLHLKELILRCPERLRTQIAQEFRQMIFFQLMNHGYERVVRYINCHELIFPFGVPRNHRIVIYGAGTFGMQLYQYLSRNGFHIVLWCDQSWESFQAEGFCVSAPENILANEYDDVLMAIAQYEVAEKAANALTKVGVPENKIRFMDVRELTSDRLANIFA